MRTKKIRLGGSNAVLTILKGAMNALIVSLLSILLFAFVIKLTSLNDGWIKPINQIIKILSILIGCIFAFKKDGERTLLKGAFIGVVYTILAFVLFSILNGKFEFSLSLIYDVLFGALLGVICAIICNIFRKK
ncbi:MAG: TIGR04086 family membrane protein [Christensenellales bacterium]